MIKVAMYLCIVLCIFVISDYANWLMLWRSVSMEASQYTGKCMFPEKGKSVRLVPFFPL